MAYYGFYELRVIRGGDAADPIIEAAAFVQQALSSAVGAVGILPIVALLVGIIGAAAGFGWRRVVSRRRRTADAEQS